MKREKVCELRKVVSFASLPINRSKKQNNDNRPVAVCPCLVSFLKHIGFE